MKFVTGQRVISKKLGLPVSGEIANSALGAFYYETCGRENRLSTLEWDKHYPDWKTKNVYIVRVNDDMSYTYPEDDLELL